MQSLGSSRLTFYVIVGGDGHGGDKPSTIPSFSLDSHHTH